MRINMPAVQMARGRIKQIKAEELPRVRNALAQALTQARTHQDPNLSQEGLDKKRREMSATAKEAARQRLAELDRELNREQETITDAVSGIGRPPQDPAAALLAEQRQARAWERSRRLLEAGRPVGHVIRNAPDADAVQALRAELPGWLESKGGDPANPATVRALDVRLSEVLGGEEAAALKVRLDVDTITPGLRVTLGALTADAAEDVRGGMDTYSPVGGGLQGAFAAMIADAQAAAMPEPDAEQAA